MSTHDNELVVSIIKLDSNEYIEEDTLVDALRDHVSWVRMYAGAYQALVHSLPAGMKVLVDQQNQSHRITTIDEALAAHEANELERQRVAQTAQTKTSSKTKVATKKATKGLTPKQQRELEALRKELEKAHG